jgi:xanthine/uracil permease
MSVNMGTSPVVGRDDRSVGELLGELMRETATLVQQEVNLAKTEMSQKAVKAGSNVGAIAVGGAVLYAGVLTLVAALILMLAHFQIMSPWVAALVIGVAITIVGVVLVKKGMEALKHFDPAPRQTIETLKEDKEWVQQQLK